MPIKDPETRRKYQRDYNKRNRKALLAKKKVRRVQQRNFIWEHKQRPCVDCNVQYDPWVMDFDHVRGEKKYDLNRLAKVSASWDTILAEIAKCDVVCSNCHRKRTYERKTQS